jgi:hypothetical protein
MKIRSTAVALLLLALPILAAVPLAAQQGDPGMEAIMKAATPGEPHKHLARLAGNWTYTSKMWMDPSQPPMESNGVMSAKPLLGGRYVEHHWSGTMMGMPFEGRGTDGYDNVGKQFLSSWIDNMSTGIMYQTGTCDEGVKNCTFTGDVWDPMTGKKTTLKSVITWMDDNSFKNEMYANGPDGKEMKVMELAAKRK